MKRTPKASSERQRNANTKLAQRRQRTLELAIELGDVTKACLLSGCHRSSFYEWKRRFELHGFEGLKNLSRSNRTHPQTTPDVVVERIKQLALVHPASGCNRHQATLASEGIRISAITIQKILNDNGLGSRIERWLVLETRHFEEGIEITPEQTMFLEKMNPCFRERHIRPVAPGEILAADTIFVGTLWPVGKVYLHAVVDTFCSYSFGFLHTSRKPEAAVALLRSDVLPFYRDLGLDVKAVFTDSGREFCGDIDHPYELYLHLNGIEHRGRENHRVQMSGFFTRFAKTVLDEFFRFNMVRPPYKSVSALQADLDGWLFDYNTTNPHLGYPNHGKSPEEIVKLYFNDEI